MIGLSCLLRRPCRSARLAMMVPEEDLTLKLNALFGADETERFLQRDRPALVGSVNSHALLQADRDAGLYPPGLDDAPSYQQMAFVDEPRCIGCGYCAQVARSTFAMGDLGLARAYEQGADEFEVVEEAMLTCPSSCIHWVSEEELRLLELARSDDALARTQARRLVSRAEGSGAGGDWREPLRSLDRAAQDAALGAEFR